jgi:hypothetical protein
MSDSHDYLPKIKRAVEVINGLNVELVLHAGDYCAPFAAGAYQGLKARLIGVFGNNDAEHELIKQKFNAIGHEIRGRFADVKAGDMKIAVTHGDEADLLNSLKNSGAYNVVLHGHDHQASITKVGTVTVINPGEICGYLTGRYSVAVLDTQTSLSRIIEFE